MTTQAPPPESTDPWHAPAPAAPNPAPAPALWPPYPGPGPVPRNGLGVAAMVLGIVGMVLALTLVLFWFAWLLALVAVVLGVLGLRLCRRGAANNRGAAMAGVILGVLALLVSSGVGTFMGVSVYRSVQADRAEQQRRAADEKARQLTFGQTYTTADGLKITVAKPETRAPRLNVLPTESGVQAVRVVVTVVNTTAEPRTIHPGMLYLKGPHGDAEDLYEGPGSHMSIDGTLKPGQQVVGNRTFALQPADFGQVQVEFVPDRATYLPVRWTGAL
ncbi:hypothetical protein GCM10010495_77650 [Kitasatospora herbaricolor]|uniref:DUF4190 domain-containing protein n=1 Tax=Kitasatospora herbaricolor TaxID=68217 RepID=UPI00174E7FF7|nr:DUF4190 domain-containing protein [Kitasatospora herbaricolor]MDQ0305552.1 hypothetical protein [Kitasatospora herbaricolor]GGV48312.1 hypothetical protein GCM10010495_77650 [Kitasatospora herbaricolor]